MINDLKKAKDKVEVLLNKYPPTRDCDKKLWLAYLFEYHNLQGLIGKDNYIKLRNLILNSDTVTMESVTRCRRKFQEQGLYVGTKRNEKLKEQEFVRDFFSK